VLYGSRARGATNLPNVPASNLAQIGIGGWRVLREAVAVARESASKRLPFVSSQAT
jgi:hypothetical protein